LICQCELNTTFELITLSLAHIPLLIFILQLIMFQFQIKLLSLVFASISIIFHANYQTARKIIKTQFQ